MSSRIAYICAWVIILATFIGTLIVLPGLPTVIATHWNMTGEVDGTTNSLVGAFILPAIMVVALAVFIAIPYIDPLRKNIGSFRTQYTIFVALLMLVLALAQGAILAWNLGVAFNVGIIVLPAIGVLLFYTGVILPQTKRNWFIGIRTPWTVSSDIVWKKTHELGGTLFKILGVIIILSTLVPAYAVYVVIVPLVIVVVGLVAYSYAIYREYAI